MIAICINLDYLKASLKWGPWPKVFWAISGGYFLGKLSYQGKCAEKLMSLPNSPIAEALRQRKNKTGFGPGFQEGLVRYFKITTKKGGNKLFVKFVFDRFSSEQIVMPMSSNLQTQEEQNSHANSMQEMRSEDRSYEAPPTAIGLDDNFRPSMDSFSVSDQELPPPASSDTSYEDLRRKNREDYERKKMENYRRMSSPASDPQPIKPVVRRPITSSGGGGGQKNSYGDVWEE